MPSPYITLTYDDPEFKSYLLGTFSRTLRALPIESFSQHSSRERVTFRLVPIAELKKPAWWIIYFRACRPELLGLTLGPFFLTVMWLMRQTSELPQYPVSLLMAGTGLFFLHVGAFLFNDFRDHMVGVDLANRRRGSQVIQKGWASARAVRAWAWVNVTMALLFGLPAVILHAPLLLPIILIAAGMVLALSWMSAPLVRKGVSDLLVFVGLGPMLTAAASIAATGGVAPNVIAIGSAFGMLAALTLQIRQLENLFRAGKDSFRTFIGGFEFDRAQKLVLAQIIFIGIGQIVIGVEEIPRPFLALGFLFALLPMASVFVKIRRAASPLSSDLVHLGRHATWAQAAVLLWWGAAIWI